MTQPPQPPPNEPPQGGFGAPQNPPPPGYGTPQNPPPQGGGYGTPQNPPPAPPQGPPATPPNFGKATEPDPGYGQPGPPPPPGQPPQVPPPGQPPQVPPPGQSPQFPPPGQSPQVPPPGQPSAPPAGQPGPGYAQDAAAAQQPAPFAQQGQQQYGYPGQQQYGYPGQQQYGGFQPPTAPQPVAAAGKKFNAQIAIIVAAVVAIALIIGGGVWYANSGSGGKKDEASSSGGPSGGPDGNNGLSGGSGGPQGGAGKEKVPANTSAKVLFQLPAPEVPKDAVYSVMGSWLHGKVYAKAGVDKIVGYDTDTGKETWTLPLDGQTCASSPEVTDDGLAAVVYEAAKRKDKNDVEPCSKISAIDLKTGTRLWTKEVTVGDAKARYEEASISGNTVAVGGGTDGGAAFDLKTGKALWTPQTGDCKDAGYRGGEQLVAVRTCGEYDNPKLQVQLLDPVSGEPKWTYKLPDGIDNAKVISTKPVVFGVDSGDITASGVTDVFSLDDATGKLRAKITLEDGKYAHDCGVNKIHDCHGIVVGNDRLYVPTAQHDGNSAYGQTNEIVSFNLATGQTTGDRADAGDGYQIFPLRMDGSNIIAYKDGPYDKGAQIVSLDSKTMKATTLLETPASGTVLDALSSMVPDTAEMWYADGRLFLGKDLISKPTLAGEKSYTALGFAD
jgi:hypothetical protein